MLSFPPSPSVKIFVARAPADMRKGFDGLAGEVIDVIDEDPQSGHLFVFFNKRRDRLKCLLWPFVPRSGAETGESSGFWLLYKRIEHGRFSIFDRASTRTSFEITSTELALLLDGIDLRGATRRRTHDEMMRRS